MFSLSTTKIMLKIILFFYSYNFEWTMAAAAAIFGNDNYVFWEVPLPRFQKLGGVMGKIFWEKNVFR